ncbi:MAG: stage sporulation protein [Clostridiaceae bacterium]|jgi:stage II sporulation protein R|nr:stage sporulation protein [Clostridiaceae bacterium]
MKKVICLLISVLVIFSLFYRNNKVISQSELSDKLIRFHIIANSDTVEDQALKLKIRDKVLAYISPKLSKSKSIDESRTIIKNNDNEIKKIAAQVVKSNGYNYSINSSFIRENFPIKTYGNITLPQGNYEAYKIMIGEAKGQNWWCVMFPPLCFVDISKGEVSYKETEREMRTVLTPEEYSTIDNTNKNKIQIRFKILDIINKIKNPV